MNAIMGELHDPSQPNLLDVLNKALRDGAIPAARIARARAAVAAFARLMHRPASELPGHKGYVIQQMRRLRRQPTGLSPKTLSNTRSELLYLVEIVCGRGRGPPSPSPKGGAVFGSRSGAARHGGRCRGSPPSRHDMMWHRRRSMTRILVVSWRPCSGRVK
jgi:hypothetical protein